MKDYLWIPEKKAYFYRNRNNEFVNSLAHKITLTIGKKTYQGEILP